MSRREALRMGDPHSAESVSRVLDRYGAIQEDTLKLLIDWLESEEGKKERVYTLYYETISDLETGEIINYPVIKTHKHGSFIEKYIDNQRDAETTLINLGILK